MQAENDKLDMQLRAPRYGLVWWQPLYFWLRKRLPWLPWRRRMWARYRVYGKHIRICLFGQWYELNHLKRKPKDIIRHEAEHAEQDRRNRAIQCRPASSDIA